MVENQKVDIAYGILLHLSSYQVNLDHVGGLLGCTDWGKYGAVVHHMAPVEG